MRHELRFCSFSQCLTADNASFFQQLTAPDGDLGSDSAAKPVGGSGNCFGRYMPATLLRRILVWMNTLLSDWPCDCAGDDGAFVCVEQALTIR